MPGTISEQCACRSKDLPVLVAAWNARVQPVLQNGVNNGRAINQTRLQRSVQLVVGITKGDPAAFDERYLGFAHHLADCPLACTADQMASALLS